jgi:S1-C subfamily serine protease
MRFLLVLLLAGCASSSHAPALNPHLLEVVVRLESDAGALCSGVIVSEVRVLTNRHCTEGATSFQVKFYDGRVVDGTVAGKSEEIDVAIIQIPQTRATIAVFADSNTAKVGDEVIAVGHPYGLEWSVTHGIVSGLARIIFPYGVFLQHDAAINPGNSGGPLFNILGQVIGINSMTRAQNVGLAITSNDALAAMRKIGA